MRKGKKVRTKGVICARCTYDVNGIRFFPTSDYILAMLFRGYEVKMREFRYGTPNLIIKGTLRYFPTVKVDEGDLKHRRTKGR